MQNILLLFLAHLPVDPVEKDLREADDGGQRGAELVRDVGQELRLQLVGSGKFLVGCLQLRRSLGDLVLERQIGATELADHLIERVR